MSSRTTLYLLGGLAAVVCVTLATLVGVELRTPLQVREIGGAFAMTDTTGHAVSEKDLSGKPTAIAFGFTSCPEVCPTTLSMLAAAMKRMGPDADRLNVVFVTIDPARDTPEQMKLYLSSFDTRIRGFSGTDAQTAAMAKAYGIFLPARSDPGWLVWRVHDEPYSRRLSVRRQRASRGRDPL